MIDELKRPMAEIVADYTAKVNADPFLKSYRDWIEANAFGFGERCFLWMWKRIVDDFEWNDADNDQIWYTDRAARG